MISIFKLAPTSLNERYLGGEGDALAVWAELLGSPSQGGWVNEVFLAKVWARSALADTEPEHQKALAKVLKTGPCLPSRALYKKTASFTVKTADPVIENNYNSFVGLRFGAGPQAGALSHCSRQLTVTRT